MGTVALPFKVASSSQAKQGGIMSLARSPPDYNWATWPIYVASLPTVIVEEDVLIILPFLRWAQL
jgi:hypothetical protein